MDITRLHLSEPAYPSALQKYLADRTPTTLTALGSLDILHNKTLALFCSVKCPGKLILQTYDFTQKLRKTSLTILGGFHSPMERECLNILLRSTNPIINCPARGIEKMRVPSEYEKPLAEGRLLLLSPFTEKQRRTTVEMALYRNRLVAALADYIFIAYAEPRSKTEQFCRDVLAWQKPLYTLNNDANANLVALGGIPITPDNLSEAWP